MSLSFHNLALNESDGVPRDEILSVIHHSAMLELLTNDDIAQLRRTVAHMSQMMRNQIAFSPREAMAYSVIADALEVLVGSPSDGAVSRLLKWRSDDPSQSWTRLQDLPQSCRILYVAALMAHHLESSSRAEVVSMACVLRDELAISNRTVSPHEPVAMFLAADLAMDALVKFDWRSAALAEEERQLFDAVNYVDAVLFETPVPWMKLFPDVLSARLRLTTERNDRKRQAAMVQVEELRDRAAEIGAGMFVRILWKNPGALRRRSINVAWEDSSSSH